jgi:hypothetical protein
VSGTIRVESVEMIICAKERSNMSVWHDVKESGAVVDSKWKIDDTL